MVNVKLRDFGPFTVSIHYLYMGKENYTRSSTDFIEEHTIEFVFQILPTISQLIGIMAEALICSRQNIVVFVAGYDKPSGLVGGPSESLVLEPGKTRYCVLAMPNVGGSAIDKLLMFEDLSKKLVFK